MKSTRWAVVLYGGSIGEKAIRKPVDTKGRKFDTVFDNVKDAKIKVRRMNKRLSPGEKKYYGLKYGVVTTDFDNVGIGK